MPRGRRAHPEMGPDTEAGRRSLSVLKGQEQRPFYMPNAPEVAKELQAIPGWDLYTDNVKLFLTILPLFPTKRRAIKAVGIASEDWLMRLRNRYGDVIEHAIAHRMRKGMERVALPEAYVLMWTMAVPVLAELINDPNSKIRIDAIKMIGQLAGEISGKPVKNDEVGHPVTGSENGNSAYLDNLSVPFKENDYGILGEDEEEGDEEDSEEE